MYVCMKFHFETQVFTYILLAITYICICVHIFNLEKQVVVCLLCASLFCLCIVFSLPPASPPQLSLSLPPSPPPSLPLPLPLPSPTPLPVPLTHTNQPTGRSVCEGARQSVPDDQGGAPHLLHCVCVRVCAV